MSNIKSLDQLKDFGKYKSDLKMSINSAPLGKEIKMYYSPEFVFSDKSKKPIVLVGSVDSSLVKGAKLLMGRCRTDGTTLEVFKGLKPEKVAKAIKAAGLSVPVSEKEIEDESTEGISPAMAKKIGFEQQKFEERTQQPSDEISPMSPAMAKKMEFEQTQFEMRSIAKRLQELKP